MSRAVSVTNSVCVPCHVPQIMYAALGVQLFAVGNASETYFDEDGEPLEGNFNNFLDAILSLFVLSTTENYPSVRFVCWLLSPFFPPAVPECAYVLGRGVEFGGADVVRARDMQVVSAWYSGSLRVNVCT